MLLAMADTPDRRTPAAVTAAAILAVGLFAVALHLGSVVRDVRGAPRYVTVKGFSQRPIRSDLAIWTGSLTARSREMARAYEKIEADRARVLAFLTQAGIAPDQISVSPVSIQTRFRQGERGFLTSEVESYELGQTLTLTSKDVERIENVSKEVTGLIRDGVELASLPPSFYYTGLDDLKIEMLGAASADARLRAAEIAGKTGAELGELSWATQGVFQITPAFSTEISGEGMYDTSSVEKSVRAVVTVSFGLD
jgi:hypothetical protein